MMQRFEIKNRYGLKIVGDILIPENTKGLSFVLHGLGSSRDHIQINTIAQTLFSEGYSVVNFDATNSFNESEGKYEDATMQSHYDDLEDVISWSKKEFFYKEPFVLAGSSLGGYAILQYAENYPSLVKGIFHLASVVSGKLSYERTSKFNPEKLKKWKETGWHEEVSISKPGILKRLPYSHLEERMNHDLIPLVNNLVMPILFMVGDNDISHIEDQKILYNALPENTEKEIHFIKGASHTFRDKEHLDKLKEIFSNWLKKLV